MAGNRVVIAPRSVEELAEAVAQSARVSTRAEHSAAWSVVGDVDATTLSTEHLSGIASYSPDDQVVAVRAGSSLEEVQAALAERGQCIPYQPGPGAPPSTIAGLVSLNLPHGLEAEFGSWRDWVLGMTLVLADESVCKAGSHVVKNVAGYDIHKLMIGARGTLAIIAEVVLRTASLRSLPEPLTPFVPAEGCAWIQRTLPNDFCGECDYPHVAWRGSSTLWAMLPAYHSLPRTPGDFVIRSGCGDRNLERQNEVARKFGLRAQREFDPEGKLNPGEMPLT